MLFNYILFKQIKDLKYVLFKIAMLKIDNFTLFKEFSLKIFGFIRYREGTLQHLKRIIIVIEDNTIEVRLNNVYLHTKLT